MKQEVVMGLITQLVDLPLDSTKLKVSTTNTEVKTLGKTLSTDSNF